jgi:hypothetical protein
MMDAEKFSPIRRYFWLSHARFTGTPGCSCKPAEFVGSEGVIMEYDVMVTDSFGYAKEALVGKWIRWITFLILALPFAILNVVLDSRDIISKTTGAVSWDLVPWDQVAGLILLGSFLSFFLSGYTVRILRGAKPAPEFENWTGLFFDGLKLTLVWLLWFLPFLVAMAAAIGLVILSFANAGSPDRSSVMTLGAVLLLLFLGCVAAVIASLYAYLGTVRFARTGSIREGIRFSKINGMIRALGWVSYLIALLIIFVVVFIFGTITTVLSLIPFIGWVLVLIISPFLTILVARYAALVYEKGETLQGTAVPE